MGYTLCIFFVDVDEPDGIEHEFRTEKEAWDMLFSYNLDFVTGWAIIDPAGNITESD